MASAAAAFADADAPRFLSYGRMSSRHALTVGLLVLLLLLQWPLWFAKGGWFDMRRLETELREQRKAVAERRERNARLESQIKDLAEGEAAAEAIARRELGMIRKDEMFIQFVPLPSAAAPHATAPASAPAAGAKR